MKYIYYSLIIALSAFLFVFNSCGTESTPIYNLTTSVNGEGSITPSGGEYEDGETVTLISIPESGWLFDSWSGDGSGSSNTLTIKMSSNKIIVGNFKRTVFLGENGVTIMCPDAQVGAIGIVDGIEFEVVDKELLMKRLEEGKGSLNRRVCVSLITDLRELFKGLNFNQPIGDWDVSNVTDMRALFLNTPFNQPIGDWDVSNVTRMGAMFSSSNFNQPIGDWDVSSVQFMERMFFRSPFNQNINSWNVNNVRYMSEMFRESAFNQPLQDFSVANVTEMDRMFYDSPFNQPIGSWIVDSVTDMSQMFKNSPFNQPIGNWDVSNVTRMGAMFLSSNFNQNISGWCIWRIESEPTNFSTGSPLTEENKPVWGTCPD